MFRLYFVPVRRKMGGHFNFEQRNNGNAGLTTQHQKELHEA